MHAVYRGEYGVDGVACYATRCISDILSLGQVENISLFTYYLGGVWKGQRVLERKGVGTVEEAVNLFVTGCQKLPFGIWNHLVSRRGLETYIGLCDGVFLELRLWVESNYAEIENPDQFNGVVAGNSGEGDDDGTY